MDAKEHRSSPSVAVIIVNYNSARLLNDALDGLSRQTCKAFTTLVIDNGSGEKLPAPNRIGVDVVGLSENIGFAAANNRGVQLCKSRTWVALLNPDAIPAADWLEKLLAAADREPEAACFASRMMQAQQPSILDGAGDAYHVSGRVRRRGHGMPDTGQYDTSEEVFSACAAAALYRREAFEAVGGFDEDFFCYLEDVDLGFRLRLAGFGCRYVPDAVVHHVGSATTGKDSDFVVYHGHRNLVWTYVKNMPGWLFWLYLPQHIAANFYVVVRYALQGRGRVILKAKWDAIRALPRMWRKRSEIQARRVVSAWRLRKSMDRGLLRDCRARR